MGRQWAGNLDCTKARSMRAFSRYTARWNIDLVLPIFYILAVPTARRGGLRSRPEGIYLFL